jgi:hypothetical protein
MVMVMRVKNEWKWITYEWKSMKSIYMNCIWHSAESIAILPGPLPQFPHFPTYPDVPLSGWDGGADASLSKLEVKGVARIGGLSVHWNIGKPYFIQWLNNYQGHRIHNTLFSS